ncbi:hypothetical protein NQ317_016898, partial [Molorchus minor]
TILDKITLHASELNITESSINHVKAEVECENDEKISLRYSDDVIQPGDNLLRFKYTGGATRRAELGFSRLHISITTKKGEILFDGTIMFILVSDFQPTSARKAFPCFDEPSFKAKYNIRLMTPDDSYNAISNMPEIVSKGYIFPYKTSQEGDRSIPIRIYTYNASGETNGYAMNCTKRALRFYSEYTEISYPLSKLVFLHDRIFETRNYGYRKLGINHLQGRAAQSNLNIYDEDQIEVVIYHELGHFWFGNLVTINDWWSDIWLQEGFATYMSHKLYTKEHQRNRQVKEN